MTFNLSATTPHGEFTRKATKAYTHVVVRVSARANEAYEKRAQRTRFMNSGVDARWVKDRGFVVTWHGSYKAAQAAANKPYGYDTAAYVQGIYVVDQELARQRSVGVAAAEQMGG